MSASAVDLEIRSLSLAHEGEELGLFLDMLAAELPTGRNWELLQAYLRSRYSVFSCKKKIKKNCGSLRRTSGLDVFSNMHRHACVLRVCDIYLQT